MTVGELITILQQHDPRSMVCVNGYEGGIADIRSVSAERIAWNVNTEWYYGAHEVMRPDDDWAKAEYSNHPTTDAVIIWR